MGDPGDLSVNLKSGLVEYDDGVVIRSSLNADTFWPARKVEAIPDSGSDMTAAIQSALDTCPAGSTVAFEPGIYTCNGANVTRNNISLYLPPGCVLTATSATLKAVLNVAGTVDTGSGTSLVQGPVDVAYPRGGDRTIYVAGGAESGFPADSWLWIEDDEVSASGTPTDTELELWKHGELVRVKSTSSGVINLYSPIINTYVRVGTTDPRIRAVTPVQGFNLFGGGMITNAQAGSGIAHGVRLFHTAGTTVEGMVFERCWDSGVHATRSTEIKVSNSTFRNAVRFDSRGYGFTCHASSRVTVSASSFKRLRHCVDFSVFSRLCALTGSTLIGSTTGNVNTHPSVEGVTITGNTIDGGHGQDATSNSTEYGDSTVQASGINIDQRNKSITIAGNVIRNMRFSGIYIDMGDATEPTEFITISGNVIENCQLYRRVSGAGALGNHAGIALLETNAGGVTRRGIVCVNNVLREPGQFGILVGVDHALVMGNSVYKAEDKTQAGTSPTVGIGIWAKNSTSTGAPTGIVLRNNIVTHCTQDGIRVGVNTAAVNTINCVVEGNQCISNGSNGIFLEETAQTPLVRNNFCQSNATDGINVQSASGFFLENRCISNTSYGLRLISGADNNLLKFNLFSGNGTAAFLDSGSSNYWIWIDDTNDRVGFGTTAPDSPVHIVGKIHGSSELELDGDLNHDGTNVGFHGATPVARSTGWTITNSTSDKVLDCDSTSIDELADVLATLINTLITRGDLGT